MAGELVDIFVASVRDGYVQVSAFVAVTVLAFSYVQYRTKGALVERLEANRTFLKSLAKLESIDWVSADAPLCATQLVGELEVLIPMANLIDKDEEIARLSRELEKLDKEIQRLNGKLGNAGFVEKAPAEVVEKEKAKLEDAESQRQRLNEQLEQIRTL